MATLGRRRTAHSPASGCSARRRRTIPWRDAAPSRRTPGSRAPGGAADRPAVACPAAGSRGCRHRLYRRFFRGDVPPELVNRAPRLVDHRFRRRCGFGLEKDWFGLGLDGRWDMRSWRLNQARNRADRRLSFGDGSRKFKSSPLHQPGRFWPRSPEPRRRFHIAVWAPESQS